MISRMAWTLLCLLLCSTAFVFSGSRCYGQPSELADQVIDESFFTETLYPILRQAECHLCHNDNGVATGTDLEFPSDSIGGERLTAFGLKLLDLIDRQDPSQSRLFLKPTNRVDHEGEERIRQDSDEERALWLWIRYLANLSEEDLQRAQERIADSEKPQLNSLLIRRLTHSQYNNTVRDLLGDSTQPASRFPKEDFVRGFKNQAEGQNISPLQAEAYSKAAERLASAAFRGGDHLGLFANTPVGLDDRACAEDFVRRFGLKAFRRPLTDHEVASYTGLLLEDAQRSQDFLAGGRIVVETMLQSPHFLFRVERGPNSQYAVFELVSRLSYFIWDTMPDESLLQMAAAGEIATPEQVRELALQMLDDPRSRTSMNEFLAQWFRFDRVLEATRDGRQFRQFNSEVAAAMVEETTRLFDYLVWQDRNFMEFYSANYTFLNSDLATIYDLPAPAEEFAKVYYPENSGRAGVLGHGSFLVATSKPAETSPTERGLFIRNHILSQEVPAPPPGVTTTLPEITEDKPMTNRQRLEIHLNSAACSSCHRLIDPIGLGFEQYDPIGSFAEKMSVPGSDRDEPIELELDTTARIQGIDNSEFSTPKQLGKILAESEVSQKAVVKQLFRYAFGREETADDADIIDRMLRDFREADFRFRELIVSLVTSELFLQNRRG